MPENPDVCRASNSRDKFDKDFEGDESPVRTPVSPLPDSAAAGPLSAADGRAAWDGEYHPGSVVLHIEYITDGNARLAVWTLRAFMTAALTYFCLGVVWKFGHNGDSLIRDDKLFVSNLAMASCSLAALLGVGVLFVYRFAHFQRAGYSWTSRRKRLMIMTGIELISDLLAVAFYLAPNAFAIAVPCGFFLRQVNWMG